jgi:transcriptional regulator with XRE-family HTH domain
MLGGKNMGSARTNKERLTISRMLKLLRSVEDISATNLASKIGFSSAYISELENGKKEPTLKVLNAYGEYFGISAANLLYIQEEGLHDSNAELVVRLFEKKAEDERLKRQADEAPARQKRSSAVLKSA